MKEFLFNLFGNAVFCYSLALIGSYIIMVLLAGRKIIRQQNYSVDEYDRELINKSPYTPGVSIIAPAFNEEKTIVANVLSLLDQDYPTFEVVIINDGSKDQTLEKMIQYFGLVEVPYAYHERIHTKPYKRLFKSKLDEYARLTVVDKENGGTKADAVNAGLNVARYPYFVNTDVDCILTRDAIFNCIKPVLQKENVIAVSGAMTMSNGCEVKNGRLMNHRAPKSPIPCFQVLEYLRSYFVGKMAWSAINAMPNVSGGYGLFNTEIMIAAGGYTSDSLAEDMDMVFRAIRYCCDFNRPYRIEQIPATCCWTEAPSNFTILYRQRTRWGRGLIQTFARHRDMVLNPKYRRLGLITTPYLLIFEFLAPLIEFLGFCTFIYLAFTGGVNWLGALVIFLGVYFFGIMIALVTMSYDYMSGRTFDKRRDYVLVFLASVFEPFIYHPFLTACSLIGYGKYLFMTRSTWGKMSRKGYAEGDIPSATNLEDSDENIIPVTAYNTTKS